MSVSQHQCMCQPFRLERSEWRISLGFAQGLELSALQAENRCKITPKQLSIESAQLVPLRRFSFPLVPVE
jgi:hypothetical protein